MCVIEFSTPIPFAIQNPLANILYCRRVFRLHRYKTIGNHRPSKRAIRGRSVKFGPLSLRSVLPIDRTQLVSARKFVRQRHPQHLHMSWIIDLNIGCAAEPGRHAAQGKATLPQLHLIQNVGKQNHWSFECLISGSYSGFNSEL